MDELAGIQDSQVSRRKGGVHESLSAIFNSVWLAKDTGSSRSSYFSKYRYHENSVQEVRETLLCSYNQVLGGPQRLEDIKMHEQCVTPWARGAGRVMA